MFPDSQIAKKFSSARTKTTAVVTNVLAPYFHQKLVDTMKADSFSLLFDEATDVSVVKTGCMAVHIFDQESGIVQSEFFRLIDLGKKG